MGLRSVKVAQSGFLWVFVANIVFQGPAALTLDGKGRIAVPARHRELLMAMGCSQLTITKHPEGSLMIFPRPAWETFRDKVSALPMEAAGWKRVFLGNAMDVEMDGTEPRADLARAARRPQASVRDTMLLGMGNHFELWDKAALTTRKRHKAMQGEMPESLKSFSF